MTVTQQKIIYAKLSIYAHLAYRISCELPRLDILTSKDGIEMIARTHTKKELLADLRLFNEFLFTPTLED